MVDPELLAYYQARAAEYEQIYYRDIPERRRELEQAGDHLKELAAAKDVLDLACGTGYWTRIMTETADSVLALDLSSEMLRKARQKAYETEVLLVQADLYRLPIAPAAFDVVTLGFWFSHEPKQHYTQLLTNISRLLRPHGLVWMIDNNYPAEGLHQKVTNTDMHGNTYKRRYLNDGSMHVILKNYFTESQLRGVLGRLFHIDRLSYGTYYWTALLSRPT